MNIVICTIKTWNIDKAWELKRNLEAEHNIIVIDNKMDLNFDRLQKYNPEYIFFPHWSYIIPKEIYENWNCVVFHMTDLPYGRGGSPLQNLIVRGVKETKISAIHVNESLDAGPIYLKENLKLNGAAKDIYMRASNIIFERMIPLIIEKNPKPMKQEGKVVVFKRRTSEQSELLESMSIEQIYDYIRMLDAEGYPNAFIPFGNYKLKFSNAAFRDNKLIAEVEIVEDKDE